MKKILCLMISIAFVQFFSLAAFAEEGLFLNSTPGEDGTFEAEIAYYGEKKPTVVQFTVNFDSKKLDCAEAFSGDALQGTAAPTIHITDGKVYFVWDSLSASSEGTFLKMIFKGKTEASGEAAIGFDTQDSFLFVDGNYNPLCTKEQIPSPIAVDLGHSEENKENPMKEPEKGSEEWVPTVLGGVLIFGIFGFFFCKKAVFGRKM